MKKYMLQIRSRVTGEERIEFDVGLIDSPDSASAISGLNDELLATFNERLLAIARSRGELVGDDSVADRWFWRLLCISNLPACDQQGEVTEAIQEMLWSLEQDQQDYDDPIEDDNTYGSIHRCESPNEDDHN